MTLELVIVVATLISFAATVIGTVIAYLSYRKDKEE